MKPTFQQMMELRRFYVVLEKPVQKNYDWKRSFVVLMIAYIDVAVHVAKKLIVYKLLMFTINYAYL